jgi:NAD(P)-dependent dehydrogenase (short-subunit alcohol dehydrogenase family)
MTFLGKTIIVISTASGIGARDDIGAATALAFAREGAEVVLMESSERDGEQYTNEMIQGGGQITHVVIDPLDLGSFERAISTVADGLGHVDALVISHFGIDSSEAEGARMEQLQKSLTANLLAPFTATMGFLSLLKEAGTSAVVYVGSIDGTLGNPNLPFYSVAKGGLHVLTHVLAAELASSNIRVNCVARAISDGVPMTGTLLRSVVDATPLARVATAMEYAYPILFLASPRASYITGAVLPVDGGRTAVTPGAAPGYGGYLSLNHPSD